MPEVEDLPPDRLPARAVREFRVAPRLPDALAPLRRLAENLWWSWNRGARALFESVDPGRFARRQHNAIRLLEEVSQERLDQLASDPGFLHRLAEVTADFDAALEGAVQLPTADHGQRPAKVAYFCAEFGLHECLPFYSGGLGVLAGDTLKSASDLGIDLVAVGLAYHYGYFEQRIGADDRQHEVYVEQDFSTLPMRRLHDGEGRPILIEVPIAARRVRAQLWWVAVGRVPLILLDTNVEGASAEDRAITARLYGGDHLLRLEQEVLLGIGGMRALEALHVDPETFHMNEGHSALLTLAQTARNMKRDGLDFESARALAAATNVFTTHTPVPAGHDDFDTTVMRDHLQPFAEEWNVDVAALLALGVDPEHVSRFSMTVLGMRMARYRNGVSRLHGDVSRLMWQHLWDSLSADEVPIDSITNGVHAPTWLAADLCELFDRELGPSFTRSAIDDSDAAHAFSGLRRLPDDALFECRGRLRRRLVHELERRLRAQERRAHEEDPERGEGETTTLDPNALTIGFCRRFATYKRAHLLFHDLERLERLLGDTERPVQFVFAGKAHPRDEPGKEFVHLVAEYGRKTGLRGRLVFVEGYDLELARCLVQGVDVWMNTPRRPYEASGTSGMKAAMNGVLNLSILDGWWCEGYHGGNGWTIGDPDTADDRDEATQDRLDAQSLYELLESEVVPAFYDRDEHGLPRAWLAMVRESLASLSGNFGAHRMVRDYERKFYRKALRARPELMRDEGGPVRELTRWMDQLRAQWDQVKIEGVHAELERVYAPGEEIEVVVQVRAAGFAADQLRVELVHGPLGEDGALEDTGLAVTEPVATTGETFEFRGRFTCQRTGRLGLAVRVRPYAEGLELLAAPTLFHWS